MNWSSQIHLFNCPQYSFLTSSVRLEISRKNKLIIVVKDEIIMKCVVLILEYDLSYAIHIT